MLAASNVPPNGPVRYAGIWLIVGLLMLLVIALWFGVVFWITRKKQSKSLTNLGPVNSTYQLSALKAKYLHLIDQAYQSYQLKELNKRELHRNLSIIVRYFVYEANHFPAPTLTLADLKHAPFPWLTELISEYYIDEFGSIEHGEPSISVDAAKGLIQRWP